MDLGPLGRKRISRQHHQMLPAIQTADPAIGAVVGLQSRCVTLVPDGSFNVCRLQLAVPAENSPLTADEQERAIDSSSARRVEFGNADRNIDPRSFGGGA
jgi:hypothetical protein